MAEAAPAQIRDRALIIFAPIVQWLEYVVANDVVRVQFPVDAFLQSSVGAVGSA